MADFLTRHGIVHHMNKIIREAEEELFLVSPYLQFDDTTMHNLGEKPRRVQVNVVYGKKKLDKTATSFLNKHDFSYSFLENLHAKCYLNEQEALITSMNLYKYSQENNEEMGILVFRQKDRALYDDIYQDVQRLLKFANQDVGTREPAKDRSKGKSVVRSVKTKKKSTSPPKAEVSKGFCIGCKNSVQFKPEDPKPYCYRCYTSWSKTGDQERRERHCYACGKKHATSMSKPLCRTCFREYKSVFQPPVVFT